MSPFVFSGGTTNRNFTFNTVGRFQTGLAQDEFRNEGQRMLNASLKLKDFQASDFFLKPETRHLKPRFLSY